MKALDFVACGTELYARQMEPVSRQYGLTAMELSILLFLANNPEYDTARDIVEKRYLAKSHVSVSIRSLEEKGLLRREYRNGDRRTAHLVPLRAAGEIIADGQRVQAAYIAALLAGLSDSDIEIMRRCLDQVGQNALQAMREISKNE